MSDVLVSSVTVAPAPPTTDIVVDADATDAAGKIKVTLRVRPTGG